jgi:hypothetical protein
MKAICFGSLRRTVSLFTNRKIEKLQDSRMPAVDAHYYGEQKFLFNYLFIVCFYFHSQMKNEIIQIILSTIRIIRCLGSEFLDKIKKGTHNSNN